LPLAEVNRLEQPASGAARRLFEKIHLMLNGLGDVPFFAEWNITVMDGQKRKVIASHNSALHGPCASHANEDSQKPHS